MKNSLRIAHIFSADANVPGGVQTHVYFLTKYLARNGNQINTYAFGKKPLYSYQNYFNIGNRVSVPLPNGNWGEITLPNEKITRLIKKLSNKEFDICHIHSPYVPFVSWQIMTKVTNTPIITTFHSSWENQSIMNVINPALLLFKENFSSFVKAAIFISKQTQKRWKAMCNKKVKQVVIPNAVDSNLYFPIKKSSRFKQKNLLFVGRLVPCKGLMLLLKALKKLKNKKVKFNLKVIGDGSRYAVAKNYIALNNLEKEIKLLGKDISQKEKIRLFQSADIFCAPYGDEGLGITILEALACGCPIVGYKTDILKEVLDNYPAPRFLAKPRSIKGLTKALISAINNNSLLHQTRIWCIKESKKYSWENMAKKTEKSYYKILKH